MILIDMALVLTLYQFHWYMYVSEVNAVNVRQNHYR